MSWIYLDDGTMKDLFRNKKKPLKEIIHRDKFWFLLWNIESTQTNVKVRFDEKNSIEKLAPSSSKYRIFVSRWAIRTKNMYFEKRGSFDERVYWKHIFTRAWSSNQKIFERYGFYPLSQNASFFTRRGPDGALGTKTRPSTGEWRNWCGRWPPQIVGWRTGPVCNRTASDPLKKLLTRTMPTLLINQAPPSWFLSNLWRDWKIRRGLRVFLQGRWTEALLVNRTWGGST